MFQYPRSRCSKIQISFQHKRQCFLHKKALILATCYSIKSNNCKINANSLMCEIFCRCEWQELCQGGQNKISNVEISSHCEGIYVSANWFCVCGANVDAPRHMVACKQQAKLKQRHPAVACSTVFSLDSFSFHSYLSSSFHLSKFRNSAKHQHQS